MLGNASDSGVEQQTRTFTTTESVSPNSGTCEACGSHLFNRTLYPYGQPMIEFTRLNALTYWVSPYPRSLVCRQFLLARHRKRQRHLRSHPHRRCHWHPDS